MSSISSGTYRDLATLGLLAAGLVGLACQTDTVQPPHAPLNEAASVRPTQRNDEPPSRVSFEKLRALLPASAGWMPRTAIDQRTTPENLLVIEATYESSDRDYLKLAILESRAAPLLDAAGNIEPQTIANTGEGAFHEHTPECGHRVLWRGNPRGADAGGVVKVLIGDRFMVVAEGNRLTLETIGSTAHNVGHLVAALYPSAP